MKFFSVFIFILFCTIFNLSYAEDALTVKQQLDRIIEEVSDLNKAVFNKSFDKNNLFPNDKENDIERFTSIDIRIYDLEKDIKKLTLQFEEILFKLDDLSNNMNSFEVELISKLETLQNKSKTDVKINNQEITELTSVEEENSLGKIIISDNIQITTNIDSEILVEENEQGKNLEDQLTQEIDNMLPEEQLQFAFDQMRKKNFDKSKKTLENFVIKFPENQLSGSAYFWLGKIFLFEKNYKEAVQVFGEGVQKFPKSIRVGEMYYELVKSLTKMDKIPEACKTFSFFKESYKGDKFAKDPDNIMDKMSCEN
jgi:TolA-binding protein